MPSRKHTQSTTIAHRVEASVAYRGPIPDPETLARYSELIPNAPERILRMAELQAEHRRDLESRVIRSDTFRATLGVWFAFIICMTTVLTGGYIALQGHAIEGTLLAGGGLAGIAGTFIYGTRSRKEERQRKDSANQALTRTN